jgi:hypothetical protein
MRRHLTIIVFNVLLFLLLAELAAVTAYYFETGHLFYVHRKTYPTLAETAKGLLSDDALQPYFGPIHRPGVRPESNNFGFSSPHTFPFTKASADQFIIGIFGGSVGEWFCRRGTERLVAGLTGAPRFAGKQIVPLCFSHEGYKQPQQLLVLSYFLSIGQPFDLVINIDGFNEVALGSINHQRGRDFSMPSPLHLDPLINLIDKSTLTTEQLYSLAAINRDKEELNRLAERLARTRIASLHFALDRYYARRSERYRAELVRFANLPATPPATSVIEITPELKPLDETSLYEEIAAHWIRSSRLMHDLLAARGVPYLHVLQPNQYFGERRFSSEEARLARSDQSPFKAPIEQGYPYLVKAASGEEFTRTVRFVSAVGLFDGEPAIVYEDDCCHYNELGNRLLADFVAARILEMPAAAR